MDQRKKLEELAKLKGVELQAPAAQANAGPAVAQVPADSWFGRQMPAVAQLLADLKASMPAHIWAGVVSNLRAGRGYAVDEAAGLAIGSPPVEVYERGRAAAREGFTVSRVRRRQ